MAAPEGGASAGRDRIVFLVRGGESVPSCRFRAYQYREPLMELGADPEYIILEKSRNPLRQIAFHLSLIPRLAGARAVVFQKLLEPGRLRFLRLFNRNLFFDFDDAMYAAPDGAWFSATMRAAPRIIAGNPILAARAARHNPAVSIVPTVVPLPEPAPAAPRSGGFVLSWIGTAANLKYLDILLPVLEGWSERGADFRLRILTEKPEQAPRRPWIEAMAWSREAEEREFRACDAGLMPLEDSEWARGKCACKALQYLSYGKPVVVSPVGVNAELFADKPFASLATDPAEWDRALTRWRDDPEARARAAVEGREFVKAHFEVKAWAGRLLGLLLGKDRARNGA